MCTGFEFTLTQPQNTSVSFSLSMRFCSLLWVSPSAPWSVSSLGSALPPGHVLSCTLRGGGGKQTQGGSAGRRAPGAGIHGLHR